MARSHVCLGCGTELARVRAAPDPHYGLAVVVCPSCGRASVRRPHAGKGNARALRHLVRSTLGLAWRVAAVGATVLLASACIAFIASGLDRYRIMPADLATGLSGLDRRARHGLGIWFDSGGAYAIAGLVIAATLAGSALVALLEHWRPVRVAAAWACAVAGVLFGGPFLIALGRWTANDPATFARAWSTSGPSELMAAHAAAGCVAALVIAVCTTPIGASFRAGAPHRTARRFRRRRARLRRIRGAGA